MNKNDMYRYERKYWNQGNEYILGLDEVGRGPWAGPLVVAGCILPKYYKNDEINDSKKLSMKKRERLFEAFCAPHHLLWSTLPSFQNPQNYPL